MMSFKLYRTKCPLFYVYLNSCFNYCLKFKIKERTCVNCGINYIEAENGNEACVYHNDKVLTSMRKLPNGSIHKSVASIEKVLEIAVQEGNKEAYSRYFYLCCMKSADQSDAGCQKGRHKERHKPQARKQSSTNSTLVI